MAVRTSKGRRALYVVVAAALAGLALVAAGCGGSSGSPGAKVASTGASSTGTTTPTVKGNPAAFSACMRKHGVANMPDPDSKGRVRITGGMKNGKRFGVDGGSPQFASAARACRKYAPNGGKVDPAAQAKAVKAMLSFARCMRSHGVPKFPDPQVQSGGGVMQSIGGKNSGVDPGSPVFQAAQKTCQKLMPDGGPMTQASPA